MKEFTWRCRWVEVRVRMGFRGSARRLDLKPYRVASRDRTAALRETLLRRLSSAVKG